MGPERGLIFTSIISLNLPIPVICFRRRKDVRFAKRVGAYVLAWSWVGLPLWYCVKATILVAKLKIYLFPEDVFYLYSLFCLYGLDAVYGDYPGNFIFSKSRAIRPAWKRSCVYGYEIRLWPIDAVFLNCDAVKMTVHINWRSDGMLVEECLNVWYGVKITNSCFQSLLRSIGLSPWIQAWFRNCNSSLLFSM